MDVNETGVVIPAYNAEETIQKVIDALCSIGFRKDHIIVVDDGSHDRTAAILRRCGVYSVSHARNMGKGAALKTGFQYARERSLHGVVTLDADGQHRIEDVPRLLAYRDRCDMVLGTRSDVQNMPLVRRLVNRITSLVISILSHSYVPDVQCGLRYISMIVLKHVDLCTNHYQTESEIVYKTFRRHYRICFVPVATLYNSETSYIHPLIDTLRFIGMAVGFLWR